MEKSLTYRMRGLMLLVSMLTLSALSVGQTQVVYPVDTIDGRAVYRYKTDKSIGLYRISVHFGVTRDEIVQWNPQLQNRVPHVGEELLIPVRRTVTTMVATPTMDNQEQEIRSTSKETPLTETKEKPLAETKEESLAETKEESLVPQKHTTSTLQPTDTTPTLQPTDTPLADNTTQDTLRLALLLPLNAQHLQRDANDDRFYDFYVGSLLAIYHAQNDNLFIELHTYDTERSINKMHTILSDPFLKQANAIIGPAYSEQVSLAAQQALQDSMVLIVPFTSTVNDIETNPYLVQFNPTTRMHADMMAEYIKHNHDSIHCVLVESKNEVVPYMIQQIRQDLLADSISIATTTIHRILIDSLQNALQKDKVNFLIFNTEKQGNLQVLLPHLEKLTHDYKIRLLSHYNWETEHLVLPNTYTSVFNEIDPDRVDYLHYEEDFRTFFHHKLSSTKPRYDLLGYDIMNHLINQLLSTRQTPSTSLQDNLCTPYKGIITDIRLHRVSQQGGLMNQNIHIIEK